MKEPTIETVRAVTRAVVARIGDAGPEVIEAVVSEVIGAVESAQRAGTVTTARGAVMLPMANGNPSLEYCQSCVEQERARGRERAVMTTTGKNTKGVVAKLTGRIAELGGDILDISQTLISDY